MNDNRALYREGRRAAAWGMALTLGLGIVKGLGGLFGNSLALMSDAVHSLVDAAISGALLAALFVAGRPADPEHPYGHGRAEAVAGAGVALLLVALALAIAWEALGSPPGRQPVPAAFTLVIAAGCGVFQEGMFRYSSRVARRTGSGALLAAAWDYRLDAFGALAVVVGVSLAKWGGPTWLWADHVAALLVAATVLWVGGGLLRDNIDALMDRQAPQELLDTVRREARAVPGVLDVETLRVRKVGLEYLIDIHIEVDPSRTVVQGHAIAHAVEDHLAQTVNAVGDVLVHVEPYLSARALTADVPQGLETERP